MPDVDELLAQLGNHPGWPTLREHAKQLMDAHFRGLAREFATRNNQPDYAQLQWERGVFAGIKFLLDNPTIEARKLERLLAQQDEVS